MKNHLGSVIWVLILACVASFLACEHSRDIFEGATKSCPVLMGFAKFALLATMGELLGRRIVDGYWKITNIRILQRAFVWGFLGVIFTYVFPIYSAGVDLLVSANRLPVFADGMAHRVSIAFWKSFWINILFAFPFMTFHRVTDMLIDRGQLLQKWPFMDVWNDINWKNMWGAVAPTIIWFWIPAHTITFSLPPVFRIIMAAGLSICLGGILSIAKKNASK